MSKTSVGDIYERVIQAVCEHSQVDFEEGGVDQGTLDLLKSEWQKKLSQLKVAQLPWDPPPPPPLTPSVPSNSRAMPHPLPSNGAAISTPPSTQSNPGPRIKQEPNAYPPQVPSSNPYQMPMPNFPPGGPVTAQQRAAMNLHQRYGQQAAQQINQLQQQNPHHRPQVPPQQQQMNFIKQEDQKPTLASLDQYSPNLQAPRAPVNTSQTDGTGDSLSEWRAEYARRKALASQAPGEGERLFRQHLMEEQSRLEGGGLLLPLNERQSAPNQNLKRKIQAVKPSTSSTAPLSALARAQGDAAGDTDSPGQGSSEVDEDAITSDLDDPEDLNEDPEAEGDADQQVMLCTYDKVNRVKNKWKCNLKDGILRSGGAEYVFHKGQGEFEW